MITQSCAATACQCIFPGATQIGHPNRIPETRRTAYRPKDRMTLRSGMVSALFELSGKRTGKSIPADCKPTFKQYQPAIAGAHRYR